MTTMGVQGVRHVLLLAILLAGATPASASYSWRPALPGYRYAFPRDHASHPEFRTEWWYYTGHLRGRSGARFGFELTFFRVGVQRGRQSQSAWALKDVYFAHFALTDENRRRYFVTDRISRGALGTAGARTDRYEVWIDDWRATLKGDTHHLRAAHANWALDLRLRSRKPPVIHGIGGASRKAAGRGRASHYYSLTRMGGEGKVRLGDDSVPVQATAWMDHEFGSNQLTPEQSGWDWYSVQLNDGRELMLYVLRRVDGTIEPVSSGTLVTRDGRWRHLRLAEFQVRALGRWRSPKTGSHYPSGWRIQVPGEQLDLRLEPTVREQEVVARGGGLAYWEGSVRVTGRSSSRGEQTPPAPVTGAGYVELTGYARNSLPGF
jgi:predicted secreted hydrolase